MARQVKEPVDLGDRHLLRTACDLEDLVSGLHLAFFENAEVEARAAVRDEQRRNTGVVQPDPDAVASDAGLADLEDGAPDPKAVADAHLVVGEPFDREVLAELAVYEVASAELALPIAVGVDLVDERRPHLAAVPGEIALSVPLDVELGHPAGTRHGFLEHAGEHGLALPLHVLRQADVDRQQGPNVSQVGTL